MKKAALPLFQFLLLNTLIAKDTAGARRHSLDIEAFVLLHELEMQQITLREAINDPIAIPIRLIREVLCFQEGDLLSIPEDGGVEAVEKVAIAPFPDKLRRVLQAVGFHNKHFVVLRLYLKHFLKDDFFVQGNLNIELMIRIARVFPYRGEVGRRRG